MWHIDNKIYTYIYTYVTIHIFSIYNIDICTRTTEVISMYLPIDSMRQLVLYSWLRANSAANRFVQFSYCAQQCDYWQLDEHN